MDESEHGGGAYHMNQPQAENLDTSSHGGVVVGVDARSRPVGGVQNPRKYNQYTKDKPPSFPKNQTASGPEGRSNGTPSDFSTQSAPVQSKRFDLEDLSDPRNRR